MRNVIKFEGVIDHLDIISEQEKKSIQLIDTLCCALNEVAFDDVNQKSRIMNIIGQAEKFQKNAFERRELLLEIVAILKKAAIKTEMVVSEIGYKIDKLSDGGHHE